MKKTLFSIRTNNFLSGNLLAIEVRKTKILMNKPCYLGLSVLQLGKIFMFELWYDYVKPERQNCVI